ncbi:MAG TPA: hypothetical protein DD417_15875 [Elusimicrobia bacterium]|nr:hypothetical protein [Elusimicrobiota bacterium]
MDRNVFFKAALFAAALPLGASPAWAAAVIAGPRTLSGAGLSGPTVVPVPGLLAQGGGIAPANGLTLGLSGVLPTLSGPAVKTAAGSAMAQADLGLPPAAIPRDAHTGIYGLTPEQAGKVVAFLKERYGDDLIDLAVVGSRARGTASVLKGYRPVHAGSDLDLVPLLRRDSGGRGPSCLELAKELAQLLGFPVEVHSVIADNEQPFKDAVPFYGGGNESWYYFNSGEAVRIPLTR